MSYIVKHIRERERGEGRRKKKKKNGAEVASYHHEVEMYSRTKKICVPYKDYYTNLS